MSFDIHAPPTSGALDSDERPAGTVLALAANVCSVLRAANQTTWLDRDVYRQTRNLHAFLTELAQSGPLELAFGDGVLSLGDERLEDPPNAIRQLLRMARRKKIAAVHITAELTLHSLMTFLSLLQTRIRGDVQTPAEAMEGIRIVLEAEEEPDRIDLAQVRRKSRLGHMLDGAGEQDNEIRALVAEMTAAIDQVVPAEAQERAAQRSSTLLELVGDMGSAAEVTLILASLRRHDEYTYDHSINVGLLSIALARAIGWSGRDLQEFGVAALIHDVGKLYTPLEVLNKPGRLTPSEWVVMKKHPRDGWEILKEAGVGSETAPFIALEHHTSYDGTGYPPLPHKHVHLGSQIVKIADVYDAFTTIRPYRSQARPKEVLKMLRKQAGTHFHPDLMEAFCAMMGDYPIGSTVKLSSGRIGLVVETHLEHPERPVVRMLQDEKGRKPPSLVLIDLTQRDPKVGGYLDSVEEAIDPVIRNIPVGRYI